MCQMTNTKAPIGHNIDANVNEMPAYQTQVSFLKLNLPELEKPPLSCISANSQMKTLPCK